MRKDIIFIVLRKNKLYVFVLGLVYIAVLVAFIIEGFDRGVFSTMLAFVASMITLWNANKESPSKCVMMWSAMFLFVMAFCSYIYTTTEWYVMLKSFVATVFISLPLLYLINETHNEEKRHIGDKD